MDLKEIIQKADFDKLTIEERLRVEEILEELQLRKKDYPILDFKLLPHQQKIIDAIARRNEDGTPYYKYIIMMGGNGAGKTIVGGYAMICKMLGHLTKKYGLPYLGASKVNKIVTSTGTQLKENIEPYLLGTNTDGDLLKIPLEVIKKVTREKDVLKKIDLYEGGVLYTGTYDQGMTRLQGGTPSYLWLDEIPERWKDFDELTKRTRDIYGQFLITFTPTNYNKKIYDWIHHEPTEEETELYGEGRRFFIQVDALDNTKANHSHMIGKSDEDLQIVRFGKFIPPTGLVFKSFNRNDNVIEHIHPKKLGSKVRFYGAIDFGLKHLMSFLFIAVDRDGHIYIFDAISESNLLLKDLVSKVNKKKEEYGIEFEYIIADSAGARERAELKSYGIKTRPANKKAKVGNMSNRRGGIMKINQLFNLGKIIISDKCKHLIEELETHHYSEKGEDGSVVKENDDNIDAMRYFISSYTSHSIKREMKKERKRIARNAQSYRHY